MLPQHWKYVDFLKVPVLHAICLSTCFSLFNQSNMKPGDLIPRRCASSEGFWEVYRLSSAPFENWSFLEPPVFFLFRAFLWLSDMKNKPRPGSASSIILNLSVVDTCGWRTSVNPSILVSAVSFPSSRQLTFPVLAPLSLVQAIPAGEISSRSNPLIRVSRWDYHRGQPQWLPSTRAGIYSASD